MVTTEHITTAEELLRAGNLGPCELVRGDLKMMTPAGYLHGKVVSRIDRRLANFVEEFHLGTVLSGEPGFQIAKQPDTVRAPDVAFIKAARMPQQPHKGFFDGPPDLAVEILSPGNRPGYMGEKVADWLRSGCLVVWVVSPEDGTVKVHYIDGAVKILRRSDVLDGGDLLPGFRLPLAEIFAP
jgi:Uma2 family endonuclease